MFDRHSQEGENLVAAAVLKAEFALVATLGLTPYQDGNAWCVLWGADLQTGICGFGDTPYLAVIDFNKAIHQKAKITRAALPEAKGEK